MDGRGWEGWRIGCVALCCAVLCCAVLSCAVLSLGHDGDGDWCRMTCYATLGKIGHGKMVMVMRGVENGVCSAILWQDESI